MAVAYVGQGAAQLAFAASIALAKPTGLAVGDLMVSFVFGSSTSAPTVTLPSGWGTAVVSPWNPGDSGIGVFAYKIADAADVAASTFTFSSSNWGACFGFIGRYTGVNPTAPINSTGAAQVTNSGTTGNFPTMTTTVPNTLVVLAALYTYAATPSGSEFPNVGPAGTTREGNANQPAFSAAFQAVAFVQATAGATGAKTVPVNGTRTTALPFVGVTFAIAPATSTDFPVSWSPGSAAAAYGAAGTVRRNAAQSFAAGASYAEAVTATRGGALTLSASSDLSGLRTAAVLAATPLGASGGVGGSGGGSVASAGAFEATGALSGAPVRGALGTAALGAVGGLAGALQAGGLAVASLGALGGLGGSSSFSGGSAGALTVSGNLSGAVTAARSGAATLGGSAGLAFSSGGQLAASSLFASAALAGSARTAGLAGAGFLAASALDGAPTAGRGAAGSLGASAGLGALANVGKAATAALGATAAMVAQSGIGKTAAAFLGAAANLAPVTMVARGVSGLLGVVADFLGIGSGGGRVVVTPPCRTVYACAQNRVVVSQPQDRTVYARDCPR